MTAPVYINAAATVYENIFRRSVFYRETSGGIHDGIQKTSVHKTVAERSDPDIFGSATVGDINIAIVAIVLTIQLRTGHIAAILHIQHPSLHIHIRRTGAGRNIHACIVLDCRIRDGSAAADKNTAPFANRNAVSALTVVEFRSPPFVDADILQCDAADHAVRLERKSIQASFGLHTVDSGALSAEYICGIARFDEHIVKNQTSGEFFCFSCCETIQFAPLAHGHPFQGIRMTNDQIAAALDVHIVKDDAGTGIKNSAVFHVYGFSGAGFVHFHESVGMNRNIPRRRTIEISRTIFKKLHPVDLAAVGSINSATIIHRSIAQNTSIYVDCSIPAFSFH